jgi:hypothetical protein
MRWLPRHVTMPPTLLPPQLAHPNVVQLHDVYDTPAATCLVRGVSARAQLHWESWELDGCRVWRCK